MENRINDAALPAPTESGAGAHPEGPLQGGIASPAQRLTTEEEQPGQPAIPESIRQVLESRTFERAPTLRVLLIYLWQNREASIGEYAIATEALGRSPSFDAKTDATVRVQISRLRQRLEKYYSDEGKAQPERVIIPLGTHKLRIESTVAEESLAVEVVPAEVVVPFVKPSSASRYWAAACAALAVVTVALGILLYKSSQATGMKGPAQAPQFWQTFFGPSRSTRLLLPTPVFFSYIFPDGMGGSNTLMVRDTSINDFAQRKEAFLSSYLWGKLGEPALGQNYTVTSDTFAAVALVRYLDQFGFPTRVRSGGDGPMEALDSENLIALGTWGTLAPVKQHLERMSFRLGPHEYWVDVKNPAAGEPARVSQQNENAERSIWPGIVAVLPGHRARNGTTRLLVLASRHTSALVATLTSEVGLAEIEKLRKAKGSPEFFEMIVNCEMNGLEMARSWPVLLRPLPNEGLSNSK